jgi:hypothetical protein
MKKLLFSMLVTAFAFAPGQSSRAADDPKAVVDKGIKALGGEEKLSKVKAYSWKSKGKVKFGDNEGEFTAEGTAQGLDHLRTKVSGDFMGNKFEVTAVLAGDKGWRSNFMTGTVDELDEDALANEKRTLYLQVIPAMLLPLKDKNFKLEATNEDKVGDKPAVGVKVTVPDGKDFTIFFDKESGLPVKVVAIVLDFMGNEFTQETILDGYKDFDGIKKATKTEAKRDGEKFLDSEITEFKILDKVDPKTFAKPE